MASKILVAQDQGTGYYFRVHIDVTKLEADGDPDPAWVREYTWGKTPPQGVTAAAYRQQVVAELKALVAAELTRLAGGGNPLAGVDGTTF